MFSRLILCFSVAIGMSQQLQRGRHFSCVCRSSLRVLFALGLSRACVRAAPLSVPLFPSGAEHGAGARWGSQRAGTGTNTHSLCASPAPPRLVWEVTTAIELRPTASAHANASLSPLAASSAPPPRRLMMKAASGVVLMVLLSLTLTVLAHNADYAHATHETASGAAHDSLLSHANEPSHADAVHRASSIVQETHNRNTDEEEDESMFEPATHAPDTAFPPSKMAQAPNACSGVPYDFSTSNYCQANKYDASTYPAAPAGMVLRSVQLITRHGDRVPVNILPSYDVSYDQCGTTASQGFYQNPTPELERNAAAGEMGHLQHRKPHSHHRPRRAGQLGSEGRRLEQIPYLVPASTTNPFASQLWQGSCATGQLTTVGIAQHNELGSALRQIYVDTLGFLPSDYSRANTSFYLRSTDVWRTRQSAESLLTGLWPVTGEDLDTADVIPFHSFPIEIEVCAAAARHCASAAFCVLTLSLLLPAPF